MVTAIRRVVIFSQGVANIGDALTALCLKYLAKVTIRNSEVYVTGSPYGCVIHTSKRLYYDISRRFIPSKVREEITFRTGRGLVSDAFELIRYLKGVSWVIAGGCFLTRYYIRKDLRFLSELGDNTKILLIGIGGEAYTKHEIEESRRFLSKLRPHLLVTRDSLAYRLYHRYALHSYDGLDSVFFVSDLFNPPKSDKRYIIANFDDLREPEIPNPENLLTVRMHNTVKGVPRKWLKQENFFISDYPEDYLTLIANAEFIHTDKIHTSVVAEAYKRPYRYYGEGCKDLGKSERAKILRRVEGKDLEAEKRKELDFIKSVV
jgi:hypothetical protein